MTSSASRPLREWMAAAIVGLVGAQLLAGIFEAVAYHPAIDAAYKSEAVLRASALGAKLAAFHYWGSAAFLVVTMALVLEMVCTEGYREPARYYAALACAVIGFAFQVTGNLLPMDRHGVQTAVVEAGIAGSAPALGHVVAGLMLNGAGFSASTLALWWAAHAYILPACLIVAALAVWRRKLAPLWGYFLLPAAVAIVGLAVPAPLGNAATTVDYDQFNARVSWYTWPLHAMLRAFSTISAKAAWVGAIAVPTAVFAALLLLPWLGPKVTPIALRGATAIVAAAFLIVGFVFGGPVAPLIGNRDPAVEAALTKVKVKSKDPAVLALVAKGRNAFNTVGCTACHGKDGAKGDGGPGLTNDYLRHDAPWFQSLIRNPRSVNPSATMPAFPNLGNAQVQAIATFLSEPH